MEPKTFKESEKIYCASLSCGALIVGGESQYDSEYGILCPECYAQLLDNRYMKYVSESDDKTGLLFNLEEPDRWEDHWQGMPEFNREDLEPYKSVRIHFRDAAAIREFSRLVGQKIPVKNAGKIITSIWFPRKERNEHGHLRYISEKKEGEDRE